MDYRVAVCDDMDTDRRYIASLVSRWAESRGCTVKTDSYPSAESFLFDNEDRDRCDILLLDIEMGGMDGVSLAKTLRERDSRVQLVFITGFSDFIAEGYEVSALHYLMKPVDREKLFRVLDRAAENLGKQEKRLAVTFDRRTELIPLSAIKYIEAQRQYVAVHTLSGEYRMKSGLNDVQDELDEYFIRCHRSYIVDLRYVQRIESGSVTLKNGEQVPISRGMAQKLGREMIRLF